MQDFDWTMQIVAVFRSDLPQALGLWFGFQQYFLWCQNVQIYFRTGQGLRISDGLESGSVFWVLLIIRQLLMIEDTEVAQWRVGGV